MEGIFNGDVECFYGCGSLRTAFLEALPVTFSLVAGPAVIAIAAGVGLALICVRHRGPWFDRAITTAGDDPLFAAVRWSSARSSGPISLSSGACSPATGTCR